MVSQFAQVSVLPGCVDKAKTRWEKYCRWLAVWVVSDQGLAEWIRPLEWIAEDSQT